MSILFPLNDSLENKVGYINSQNNFTPARIVTIQRTLTYINGVATLDISNMDITAINVFGVNVVGSDITYSAYGSLVDNSKTLKSVLNNKAYNGDLPTGFLLICAY